MIKEKEKEIVKDEIGIIDINLTKAIFRIEFIKNTHNVTLHLVSVNKEYLYNIKDNNYKLFRNNDIDYSIWSCSEFLFERYQLRLPSITYMDSKVSSTCYFNSEESKKTSLRKLYVTLHGWGDSFSKDNKLTEVIMDDEYWYVM